MHLQCDCTRRDGKSSLGMTCEDDYNPHLSGVVMDEVKRVQDDKKKK